MTVPGRRPTAPAIALAVTLGLMAACVPTPVGRPTASPAPNTDPVAAATPSPASTGPTPSPSFVRPTPTPLPTFLSYVVKPGDTLDSIAKAHRTTARSLAFWNRTNYPSLDPDSPAYDPDLIRIGWVLLLVPDIEIEEDDTFPE